MALRTKNELWDDGITDRRQVGLLLFCTSLIQYLAHALLLILVAKKQSTRHLTFDR